MSYSKAQGKKQDTGQQQKNNNRNNNNNGQKKWINTAPRNHASSNSHNEPISQDPATVKLMHDRMIYLLANLTGTLVEVTVKDGSKFKGIFHGASTEGDLGIALKLAQKVHDPSTPVKNTLLIFSKDLVEINAAQVDFSSTESTTHDRNTFKTDTDISGRLDIKERELHKWAPNEEDSNALGLLEGDLESSNGEAWDQFAANEKLFGLKTDFNEEIYTTPLNRSAPGYKDREKRALKLANEIQKSSTTNVHMLEERGIAVDDSGMDEEDLYGAVVRDGKYVPPALRKATPPKKMSPLNKLITSDLPKAGGANLSPIANLPTTRRDSSVEKTPEKSPKRIETEIATTFRHFAMMEKDKLHAKKQALQKKEKDGRLAELKAFHQSFKLNVPIPADLVPLLSKGKKPATTTTTPVTTNTTTTTTTATSTPATTSTEEPPIKKTTPTPASPVTASPKSSFKFNVKASSFKPNPTAAAFVPGGNTEDKKGEPMTMLQAFTPSFDTPASSVGPTWPFGNKSYRVQFSQFAGYDDDGFTGYPSPTYGYGYPPYRYPQYGMPQPYPQFVQAPMPAQGPPYSPQMANVSPHGSPFPQGFPSPQRSPMVPPGMAPQIYQYQGGPMMMRYPPEMSGGGPPVMMQRPVMVEPMQPYQTSDSGTETPPN